MLDNESLAAEFLSNLLNGKAIKIPTSDQRTADLSIELPTEHYTVECKEAHSAPLPHESGVRTEDWNRKASADSAGRKANKQLNASAYDHSFRVLWVGSFEPNHADFNLKRFMGELYGIRHAGVPGASDDSIELIAVLEARPCRIRRMTSTDCVIALDTDGAILYLNCYSSSWPSIKNSTLYKNFKAMNAVIDPTDTGIDKSVLRIEPGDVSLDDDIAVKRYLQTRYSAPIEIILDMKRHSSFQYLDKPKH